MKLAHLELCMYVSEAGSSSSTSSFLVCSSLCLLDMPIRREWYCCPCCENWFEFIPGCREPDEWCYKCERLWEDWFAKKKWARTRAYIVMLATKSLQDNHYK